MKQFINVFDCQITLPSGRVYPGETFTEEEAGASLPMILDAGWAEEFKPGEVKVADDPDQTGGESQILNQESAVEGNEVPDAESKLLIQGKSKVSGSLTVRKEGQEEGDPNSRASRWAVDPDALRGLSLESLNGMIAERDPEIGAMETTEEAISLLSADAEPSAEVQLTE